ncbi:hypothetical protein L204_105975 [Cryptococcus depauperatus]|nr:hypothetical protein L204_05097 [Cryptococcus depauperatus CBS 7855]
MTIGPSLPPHLSHLAQASGSRSPSGSPHSEPLTGPSPAITNVECVVGDDRPSVDKEQDEDKDDYAPALPPHMASAHQTKVAGPSLPPNLMSGRSSSIGPLIARPHPEDDDSDDDVYGPVPASNIGDEDSNAYDPVKEFMELEERRRKDIEEKGKPKVTKREEWMLVPPTSGPLSSVDPLRKRPTTFSRSNAEPLEVDHSVWTETPAEKAQRIADEVAGIKRKKDKGGERLISEEEELEERRKRRREDQIKINLSQYDRGASLLDTHQGSLKSKKKTDDGAPPIWDHARDMGFTGRLLSDQERGKMIRDAKGLGDRFGHGKKGAYQM